MYSTLLLFQKPGQGMGEGEPQAKTAKWPALLDSILKENNFPYITESKV